MATYMVTVKFEVGFQPGCARNVQKQMCDVVAHLLLEGSGDNATSIIVDEGRVVSVIEQSERTTCKRCGSSLTKHGYCRDKTCLYSGHKQDEAQAEAS
jgi:tRNA pseudouridine-54 N-methylase